MFIRIKWTERCKLICVLVLLITNLYIFLYINAIIFLNTKKFIFQSQNLILSDNGSCSDKNYSNEIVREWGNKSFLFFTIFFDNFFRWIFSTNFFKNFFDELFGQILIFRKIFLTYNILTIASFRIGVPSILFRSLKFEFKMFHCGSLCSVIWR